MSSQTIKVASIQQLNLKSYRFRLWLAAKNMGLSRRKWPDEIANTIYEFNGTILCPNGRVWPKPDVDNILGDPRWFSLWFEELNGVPKREVRYLVRLQLIDLYFAIKYPDIHSHFSK